LSATRSANGLRNAAVCISALFAFVFLMHEDLGLSLSDMYQLVTAFDVHQESDYIPVLPHLQEGE
jgi:hypothetical protein